jgi:hypothetical protein
LCAGLLTTRTPRSSSTRHQAQFPPLPSPPCLSPAGAARLQQGGAPRRLPTTAFPDPRVVRRGHSSFPPARGLQYCIRGRHRPRARSLCARSTCGPENRGRLGAALKRTVLTPCCVLVLCVFVFLPRPQGVCFVFLCFGLARLRAVFCVFVFWGRPTAG